MLSRLQCLRLTTPKVTTLKYPSDAEAHFEELRKVPSAGVFLFFLRANKDNWRTAMADSWNHQVEIEESYVMGIEVILDRLVCKDGNFPIFSNKIVQFY